MGKEKVADSWVYVGKDPSGKLDTYAKTFQDEEEQYIKFYLALPGTTKKLGSVQTISTSFIDWHNNIRKELGL